MTTLNKFFSEPFGMLAMILLVLVLTFGSLAILGSCSSESIAEKPLHPSVKVAEVKQASHQAGKVYIQVIVIDGEEYLLAETYRGVSICKK